MLIPMLETAALILWSRRSFKGHGPGPRRMHSHRSESDGACDREQVSVSGRSDGECDQYRSPVACPKLGRSSRRFQKHFNARLSLNLFRQRMGSQHRADQECRPSLR